MAVIFDPNTGLYVDNVTHKVFQDPNGVTLSSNTSLNSQATRNLQIANELFARLGGDQERYKQVFQHQSDLARSLDNTIAGKGPSVVATQLEAGTEAARQTADSQASGVSGAASPLAHYAAIQQAGEASARANQSAALARPIEIAEAQRTKAAILGQQGSEANTAAGVNVVGMNSAGSTAGTEAAKQQELDQRDRERMQQLITNIVQGGGQAVTTAATAK